MSQIDVSGDGGCIKVITKGGDGPQAKNGQRAVVHYIGTLEDGKKFDSSRDRDQKFKFVLGQGRVIKGWDVGVASMKVGERSMFTLKPDYGYGSRGAAGVIPPNATLIFDVELLELE